MWFQKCFSIGEENYGRSPASQTSNFIKPTKLGGKHDSKSVFLLSRQTRGNRDTKHLMMRHPTENVKLHKPFGPTADFPKLLAWQGNMKYVLLVLRVYAENFYIGLYISQHFIVNNSIHSLRNKKSLIPQWHYCVNPILEQMTGDSLVIVNSKPISTAFLDWFTVQLRSYGFHNIVQNVEYEKAKTRRVRLGWIVLSLAYASSWHG